jgi:putative aminopeptidase FrvX
MCPVALNGENLSAVKLAQALFPIPSPPGYEEPLVEAITELLPGTRLTKRDNLGSLYWTAQKGNSKVAFCTPMDEAGYFVSGINPEGYLRLDKAVYGPSLIDSYHLGHPMIVWTENGPVEGVLALPSLHILSPEIRRELQEKPGLDLAFLDIGADSKTAAQERGVAMLDAVMPWREITKLADSKMAGYALGQKCCTAVLLNHAKNFSELRPSNVTYVWMAQTKLMVRRSRPRSSLGALRASKEIRAEEVIVIDIFPCDSETNGDVMVGKGPVLAFTGDKMAEIGEKIRTLSLDSSLPIQTTHDYSSPVILPFLGEGREVVGLLLPVKFAQTPSEIVSVRDVEALDFFIQALMPEGRQQ